MPETTPTTETTAGRFGDFNLWDDRDLSRRIPLIAETLAVQASSHGALQECSASEYPKIFNLLGAEIGESAWAEISTSSKNDGSLGFYKYGNRLVYWRPSLWDVLDLRHVMLQPDDRGVPAALIRSKATGLATWVYSVHLSHTDAKDDERDDQARQLVRFLSDLGPLPIIGAGDINDTGKVGAIGSVREILKKAGYFNLIDLTGKAPATHRGTRRLDETFVTKHFRIRGHQNEYDLNVSDHAAELVQWAVDAQVQPPPPKYLGPFQLLTDVWAVQHNPQKDPRKPKDGARKPYGKTGYRPKGFMLRNVVKLVQAKDSAGKEHTYAVTATGNRYALGDSPNKRNWVKDLSK